ncbi:hypothetical protein [Levilactobacillus acidifarinae]|uniref:Uncharacterized protein n=1 Tax=Levilactobacillus acidifarinae DSM 19394 = JCM 15949 TaxID=1423715 RepID=A0A0R1LRC1_9LACO|nr:hypothetical protein [Levilactobacillus acidifarinae]KRK96147.1 hypothetical protein FD25_GL002612 [Levilactobacillus acidifarinae DSM 19394]GEO69508.1 hypothetical protein LAC03_14180 [Levilactobacillus acidifarinae]
MKLRTHVDRTHYSRWFHFWDQYKRLTSWEQLIVVLVAFVYHPWWLLVIIGVGAGCDVIWMLSMVVEDWRHHRKDDFRYR